MNFAGHDRGRKAAAPRRNAAKRRAEAVILFSLAGSNFAIAAAAVDEIRNLDGLRPVGRLLGPSRVPKVRHLLVREGKTYYVVDANYHFCMLPSKPNRLLLLRDRPIAVQVDEIERMAEVSTICPLPLAFSGRECQWYRGLALLGEETDQEQPAVVPVVNAESFLSAEELHLLQADPALPSSAAHSGGEAGIPVSGVAS
jgi:chemotaxis signal transduction protein